MKALLRIDSSVRQEGSHSRALADHFERRWMEANPGSLVIRRDLALAPPPHLALTEAGLGDPRWSDELIDELCRADQLLVSAPIYNFGPPSSLKAYLDHVIRRGRTFEIRDGDYVGLLEYRRAALCVACGDAASEENDFFSDGFRRALRLIGIADVDQVTLDRTVREPSTLEERVRKAHREIDALFDADDAIWRGDFSDDDKREIAALRQAQARAIVAGDAVGYASLCAEDVQLMIPGRDPAVGVSTLFDLEQELFRRSRFRRFRKRPLRVERGGDLAVETGLQSVETASREAGKGIFAAKQKYVHVYRRTPAGWRFATLISNDCGASADG